MTAHNAPESKVEAVAALLRETEEAHGVYEATVLNGVYDQAWPSWYAAYAIEHGLGELIGPAITPDQLAEFLNSSFADYKEAPPDGSWAAYTARRLTTELPRTGA